MKLSKKASQKILNMPTVGALCLSNWGGIAIKEVSEEDMIDALMIGHDAIKELVKWQEEITKEIEEKIVARAFMVLLSLMVIVAILDIMRFF